MHSRFSAFKKRFTGIVVMVVGGVALAAPLRYLLGGGRGIGEAIARRFAAEGARLFITSRTPKDLERVALETGANFDICDVTQPKEIGALIRKIGPVDILINNAGIAESAPFLRTETTPDHVAHVIRFLCDDAESGSITGSILEIDSNL